MTSLWNAGADKAILPNCKAGWNNNFMKTKEGKYLIDGLEINPNPCAQTAFERGLVRGARWGFKKGMEKAKEAIINFVGKEKQKEIE